MFEKPFLYYILDASGDYYYIDNAGAIALTATATPLPNSPSNWKELKFSWLRDIETFGLTRNVTNNFVFHGDAHKILLHIYETQGADAQAGILIKFLDAANIGATVQYIDWYSADFDFSTYKGDKLGSTIRTSEAGLRELLSANMEAVYEVPLDITAHPIWMDGTFLRNSYKWITAGVQINFNTGNAPLGMWPVPVESNVFSTMEQYEAFPVFNVTDVQSNTAAIALAPMTCDCEIDMTIYYEVVNTATFSGRLKVWVFVVSASDILTSLIPNSGFTPLNAVGSNISPCEIYSDPTPVAPGANAVRHVTGTLSVNVGTSNRILVVAGIVEEMSGSFLTAFNMTFVQDGYFKITNSFRLPAGIVAGKRYYEFLYKLVDLATGGAYTADSAFLEDNTLRVFNSPYDTMVTSGLGLRQIQGGYIRSSLSEAFRDAQGQWCLGMGIVNVLGTPVVKFEPIDFWLNPSYEIAYLGKVKNLNQQPFKEGYFNKIKAGYPDPQAEFLNGQEETNTTSQWSIPITRYKNELDLTTSFRAGMYDVEKARAYLINKDSTDDKRDNEVYLLEVTSTIFNGGFELARKQNLPGFLATGILFASTAYNLALSPLSRLWRNIRRILPALHTKDPNNTHIEFRTTDRNHDLDVSAPTYPTLLDENGTYPLFHFLNNGETPYYLPITLTFEAVIPVSVKTALETNDRGYFRFTYNGIDLKIFPLEVTFSGLTTKGAVHEIKGLVHPDTDPNDITIALNGI